MSEDKKKIQPGEADQGASQMPTPDEKPSEAEKAAKVDSKVDQENKKPRSIRDIAIDFVKPFNVRNPLGPEDTEKDKPKSADAVLSGEGEKPDAEGMPEEALAESAQDPALSEPTDTEKDAPTEAPAKDEEGIKEAPEPIDPELEEKRKQEERARIAELELEEALSAAGVDPAVSTCDELRQLAEEIESGKAPWFRKTEVCIQRKPALKLIRGLTALCDAQTGESFEDELFDALASSDHQDEADFKPMYRVKNRAKSIINDAMRQADLIVNDARMFSNSLLQDTEAKIQAKYDEADSEIEARLTTTKEESTKRLSEARDELTASRKQSVDILNLYMSKAEDDYQGYWERAEQTLFASMLKSESVLGKACEIYERELKVIREDLETLEAIMEELERSRPRV